MEAIKIARRFAEMNEKEKAKASYTLALAQEEITPEEELEAASFIFFSEGDHRLPFTHFVSLFNQGHFQSEILGLMTQAFYLPNVKQQQKQYEKNVKALSRYPYLFRKDFPSFEDLNVLFFPFDHQGVIPYFPEETRFGEYVNVNDPVVDRWFFKDLSKPILARDVYSQYQLDYLNDNVRKSEWVAKENHIYLHYTSWEQFCAWLQVLDFKKLLAEEKLVFLIEEEASRYPIDFQKEYGIDYAQYPLKPVGIREVNKLICHTQLATHNGGDFFNEIMYGHPNLLCADSIMWDDLDKTIRDIFTNVKHGKRDNLIERKLGYLKNATLKDTLVAFYLYANQCISKSDPQERIVPAIFLQPHFHHMSYSLMKNTFFEDNIAMHSQQYDALQDSPLLKGFHYIKTFTPMRRPTTSHAATVRFMIERPDVDEIPEEDQGAVLPDEVIERSMNRSYLVDSWDRLYHDSRLVRFEDGKLNPKATFTALAEFLDVPYTHSMTYCSGVDGKNPESLKGNDLGFSPAAIYRTYPEWANDAERTFIEYCFSDAYQAYGYDFQYYHGESVDELWMEEIFSKFTCMDQLILNSFQHVELQTRNNGKEQEEIDEKVLKDISSGYLHCLHERRKNFGKALLKGLHFVNKDGQPLQMMTPLKLDPELLEQPLYH